VSTFRSFASDLSAEELVALQTLLVSAPPRHICGLVVDNHPWERGHVRLPAEYGAVILHPSEVLAALETAKANGKEVPGAAFDHLFIDVTVDDADARHIIALVKEIAYGAHELSVTAFTTDRTTSKPAWADRLYLNPPDFTALMRTAEAAPIANAEGLPASLRLMWEKGSRFMAWSEGADKVESHTPMELSRTPAGARIAWFSGSVERAVELRFDEGVFARRGRLVERRYTLLYDGVTLRAEEIGRTLWQFRSPIGRAFGRFVAERFAPSESFEVRLENNVWAGDMIVKRRNSSEQRSRIRVEVTHIPDARA
jgi:hypothetical protein